MCTYGWWTKSCITSGELRPPHPLHRAQGPGPGPIWIKCPESGISAKFKGKHQHFKAHESRSARKYQFGNMVVLFVYGESDFWKSFCKNKFWNFHQKCVRNFSKFVFAKTQFVDLFRFKNRIPRKNISLTCSQIDIGVPIAIHEFRSFIIFPCLWQNFHFQEIS